VDAVTGLRQAFERLRPPSKTDEDYRIVFSMGCAYLACSRSGTPTVLVPLESEVGAIGRRGGGFALNPVARVAFDYNGHRWMQPAATLECTDISLTGTFQVLVADLVRRLEKTTSMSRWSATLDWLEEWQSLLSRRPTLTAEQQLGLWGELWFMSQSREVDTLLSAWRGPESAVIDFFMDDVGVELKVSRRSHVHHVSHRQVDTPVGDKQAYLLSMWIAPDPVKGVSLAELIDWLVATVSDPPLLLKKLSLVGCSIHDRYQYGTRYVLLEEPRWFRVEDVPRIRVFDEGISDIRYVVTLDLDKSLSDSAVQDLWGRFGIFALSPILP
jgi:hypothetical protein